MEIPPEFTKKVGTNKVCNLKKALYKLKQSSRARFSRFAKVMLGLGYKQRQETIPYLSNT